MKPPQSLALADAIEFISALGVPGLMLLITMELTGYAGAAALTTALFTLGPGGMVGGILTLLTAGYFSRLLAVWGLRHIAGGVVKRWLNEGRTRDQIWEEAKHYHLPQRYKDLMFRLLFEESPA